MSDEHTDDVGRPCPDCGRAIKYTESKSYATGEEKSGHYCVCGWSE